jgi:hypothetical protein
VSVYDETTADYENTLVTGAEGITGYPFQRDYRIVSEHCTYKA